MFARILLWVLLLAAAWWLFRPRRKTPPPAPPAAPRAAPSAVAPAAPAEAMVDCAQCGLHLPDSEAVRDAQGRAYCSSAHRDAGPR